MDKLATKFEYRLEQLSNPDNVKITITEIETKNEKVFVLAGRKNLRFVEDFMNSLTDDLCSSWFTKRGHKVTKK